MKIVATIEARMGSVRLPGKVMLSILGRPALALMVERVRRSKRINEIVIATTTSSPDDRIEKLSRRLQVGCYRGEENDVLSRVLKAAKAYRGDLICELTGDCPLADPAIIDEVITAHLLKKNDYTSNTLDPRTFPRGLDVRVFPRAVLEKVSGLTDNPADRAHVSSFIFNNPNLFKIKRVAADADVFGPDIRITLDTREDLELITMIFKALYRKDKAFSAKDIVSYIRKNPHLLEINRNVRQKNINEG